MTVSVKSLLQVKVEKNDIIRVCNREFMLNLLMDSSSSYNSKTDRFIAT